MKKREVPGIHVYDAPAGGWGALWATAKAIAEQMHDAEAPLLLWRTNKPDGFDCPGCAWPDKKHTSNFQFCENGAKAVTWEATTKRAPPELFASHTVTELLTQSDYELENHGRLTGDATRSVQNCSKLHAKRSRTVPATENCPRHVARDGAECARLTIAATVFLLSPTSRPINL